MTKLRPLLASLAVLALTFGTAPVSGASEITPEQVAGDTPPATISVYDAPLTEADPAWRRVVEDDPGIRQYLAHSPSMGREIPLAVIPAGRPDAPTVYLLGGGGGAEQGRDWISLAPRAIEFYQSRDVNVVIPMAGGFTYFMDWHTDPEVGFLRGPQKWETFLTRELPGPIERELQADGHRAVVGFSMSATSALLHAAHNPGFYDAAAAFSGCASTADPVSYRFAHTTVARGGATARQLLGPRGGAHNLHNDVLAQAEGLRGTRLYISNGSGLAGEYDMIGHHLRQGVAPAPATAAVMKSVIEGGAIEAATNWCTHNLRAKLDGLGIPAQWELRAAGTHSWDYWLDDVEQSWPTIASGLGLAAGS